MCWAVEFIEGAIEKEFSAVYDGYCEMVYQDIARGMHVYVRM